MADKRVQGPGKNSGDSGDVPEKRRSGSSQGSGSRGGTANALRQAQPYIDASWQLIGSVALGALGGWWLDGRFGTRPWLLVVGSAFGLVSGMYSFLRVVSRLAAKQPKSRFKVRSFDELLDEGEEAPQKRRAKAPPRKAEASRWDEEGWDLSRGADLTEGSEESSEEDIPEDSSFPRNPDSPWKDRE